MEVVGLAVISVDGLIARHGESGVSFASAEDQAHFRSAVRSCEAAVMGRRTFDSVRERILVAASTGLCRTIMTREPDRYADIAIPAALEFTNDEPRRIVEEFGRRGYARVAVLGGGEIYDAFVEAGAITEWQLTVEPRLFGTGTRLLGRLTDQRLSLIEHRFLNESTLLLRYRVD